MNSASEDSRADLALKGVPLHTMELLTRTQLPHDASSAHR